MTTIYLIRHGEAEGNLYRRCQGHYNSLITGNGYRQIEALARRFADIEVDAVYSSDLMRAETTARAIYQTKGLPLHTDARLREVGVGIWEDKPWAELDRQDHALLARFSACDLSWSVEGSETYPAVLQRMKAAMEDIVRQHPEQTVAVVSHGSAIRTLISHYMGVEMQAIPHCDNTAVACIRCKDNHFTVEFQGDNTHLSDEISTLARQTWWRGSSHSDTQFWFRPLDFTAEAAFYAACREEAWLTIHKTMDCFDGQKFLQDAMRQSEHDKQAVMVAMLGTQAAGLIQMDLLRDAEKGIGGIPFCYVMPEYRCKKLGVQLLGQAVSTYRRLGRSWLRLRCAPDNDAAQHFYRKYGFAKVGMAQDSAVPLELLDKYIGYDAEMIASQLHF